MNKRATVDTIHIIVGVLLIGGGLSYIVGQSGLGLVITSIGLLIEALVSWLNKLI